MGDDLVKEGDKFLREHREEKSVDAYPSLPEAVRRLQEIVREQAQTIADLTERTKVLHRSSDPAEGGKPPEEAKNGSCVVFWTGRSSTDVLGGDLIFSAQKAREGEDPRRQGRFLFRDPWGRVAVFDFERMTFRELREGERRPLDEVQRG